MRYNTPRWHTSDRGSRLPDNWRAIRTRILSRDHHVCQLRFAGCNVHATDVDHIIPGDNHHDSNLQAACSKCHQTKTITEREAARKKKAAMKYRPTERHPGSID